MVWPNTVMCAVRAAPVVLAVKEKLMDPPPAPLMVSQLWSLVAASGRLDGSTCTVTASLPAAALSLRLVVPSDRYPSVTLRMALLLVSATYQLAWLSRATPSGLFSPVDNTVEVCLVAAFHCFSALWRMSAKFRLPAPSMATPSGPLSPEFTRVVMP